MAVLTETRILTSSEVENGILTLGCTKQIGKILPMDENITVVHNEKCTVGKIHRTIVGRIDGLTYLMKDFKKGQRLSLTYKTETILLYIK